MTRNPLVGNYDGEIAMLIVTIFWISSKIFNAGYPTRLVSFIMFMHFLLFGSFTFARRALYSHHSVDRMEDHMYIMAGWTYTITSTRYTTMYGWLFVLSLHAASN